MNNKDIESERVVYPAETFILTSVSVENLELRKQFLPRSSDSVFKAFHLGDLKVGETVIGSRLPFNPDDGKLLLISDRIEDKHLKIEKSPYSYSFTDLDTVRGSKIILYPTMNDYIELGCSDRTAPRILALTVQNVDAGYATFQTRKLEEEIHKVEMETKLHVQLDTAGQALSIGPTAIESNMPLLTVRKTLRGLEKIISIKSTYAGNLAIGFKIGGLMNSNIRRPNQLRTSVEDFDFVFDDQQGLTFRNKIE